MERIQRTSGERVRCRVCREEKTSFEKNLDPVAAYKQVTTRVLLEIQVTFIYSFMQQVKE